MKGKASLNIYKKLLKYFYTLHIDILSVQISREDTSSIIIKGLSFISPILFIIYNCNYTFQIEILKNLTGFDSISFIFNIFLYLTPDAIVINIGKAYALLIFYYFLLSGTFACVLLQVYYMRINEKPMNILNYMLNLGFVLIFKVFLMPIVSLLLSAIHNRFWTKDDSQYEIMAVGEISLVFLIFFIVFCGLYLVYFIENAYKGRQGKLFSCSNHIGEVLWFINSWAMSFSHVFLNKNFIWINIARIILHGLCLQYFINKHPYYNNKTNRILAVVFCVNMLTSMQFLLAYFLHNAYTLVLWFLLVNPCISFIVQGKVMNFNIKVQNKDLDDIIDIEEDWELDVYTLKFVEKYEFIQKTICSTDVCDQIDELCDKYENFIRNTRSKPSKKKHVLKCLFFIYINRSEKAYYEFFYSNFVPYSFFPTIQLQKCRKILSDFSVLEHFYSSYFTLNLKSKKSDLKVCRNLLSLCTELHENYSSLSKIDKKVTMLVYFLKRSLRLYGKLMKDYQNHESLEMYGSFLTGVLNDNKGLKYLNLAKTMSSDLGNDNTTCWILDSTSGFCIFSIEKHEQGLILEYNPNFLEILSIQKEIAPENILSIPFPPFDKIAMDIIYSKYLSTKKLTLMEDCFRIVADCETLLMDIEVNLLPIKWKKKTCLLMSCKRISEIVILLNNDYTIVGVSKNFLNVVLGYSNRFTVPQIMNKKIHYFLPNFTKNYVENGFFEYADMNNGKMRISSKSIKYKHWSFVVLIISNIRGCLFRQTSMLKTIQRRHSLNIIQFSDVHNEIFDSSKIIENPEPKLMQNESTFDSRKYEYEPESFSLSARSKKQNSDILRDFEQKITLLQLILVLLYIFSILCIIGILLFLYFYLKSFEEFNTVEKISYIASELLQISYSARRLQLINSGFFLLEDQNYYRELLKNSTSAMHGYLEEIQSSSLSIIKDHNPDFTNDIVTIVTLNMDNQIIEKINLIEALRKIAINAETLATSEVWKNYEFLMIYVNSVDDVLRHIIGCIEKISKNFHEEKDRIRLKLMLVIVIPQIILIGLFFTFFMPPLMQVSKIYKRVIKEILSIKRDMLIKTEKSSMRRMEVYHREIHNSKSTTRNRRPRIRDQWVYYTFLLICIIGAYFALLNFLITLPISSLHLDLEKYTNKDMLFLNIYIYSSYYWAWENNYSYYPNISYYTIQETYSIYPQIPITISLLNSKIFNILHILKENIKDLDIQNFLIESTCFNTGYCDNYFYNGLIGAIDDTVMEIENWVKNNGKNEGIFGLKRMNNVINAVVELQTMCEKYVAKKLDQSDYIKICIVLNFLFALSILVFYKGFLRMLFKKILLYAKVRIFFKIK
ncbi:hypothetical protein SteCoe_33132 [Stentor coeruleus]|uniref:Uncharacterized protein n=1 Tax=Stentor coeruleus TaxID=5963 RepID=A0A1R2AXI0_9CILI|nr:hypothetical protein SteCoe_33132 [Stentor coeruleus]